jgi:signal peptide peptidase SppA
MFPQHGEAWAIRPEALAALVAVRDRVPATGTLDQLGRLHADAVARATRAAMPRKVAGMVAYQFGRVAVLPLSGVVTQRPNVQFAAAHEVLTADPAVGAIVWDVDSPGGSVSGVPEAAERLLSLRGRKPTVALSNSLTASAAYWLAAAADSVSVAPSSLTGSIGVYVVHEDRSRANDMAGVSVTYVYAGAKKIDRNPDQPLTGPAREAMQQQVNDYYGQFVAGVAKGRRTTLTAVRTGFGEGDVLTANRAVAANLADRVETLPAVLARLGASRSTRRSSAASEMSPQLAQAIQRQARAAALS